MYCPTCDLRVETEFSKVTDPEDAQRYEQWFTNDEIDGEWSFEEVGDVVPIENDDGSVTEWQVAMRVDTCANCAVPIRARTYAHHWNFEKDE